MPGRKYLTGEIVREYLNDIKYSSISSKSLSRLIYSQNKEVFTSEENIRKLISDYRNGRIKRTQKPDFSHHRKLIEERMKLPKGIKNKRTPFILPKTQKRILILSDIHAPYHDEDALDIAIKFGKKNKVDTILLNGDIIDFFSVSRFMTDPRQRSLVNEIKIAKEIIGYIRKSFPKAMIIYKKGNHEDRMEQYMITKAPELLDSLNWQVEELLDLKSYNIKVVESLDYCMLGKLKVIHGHEIKTGFIAPVNPARGLFMRVKETCLQSHVHRTSEHSEKTLGGKIISTWSIGSLCDTQPDYNPYNNYNLGFAMVELELDGTFIVHNKKIVDNKLF